MIDMADSGFGTYDVLLGRGGLTTNHNGNRRFRAIVQEHQRAYLLARKKDKALIAAQIVDIVKEKGRFLIQRSENDGGTTWIEVPDKRARAKTSQALREGLDVRRKKTRPKKQARRLDRGNSLIGSEDYQRRENEQFKKEKNLSHPLLPSVASLEYPHAVNISGSRYDFIPPQAFLHYRPPINQNDLRNSYQV